MSKSVILYVNSCNQHSGQGVKDVISRYMSGTTRDFGTDYLLCKVISIPVVLKSLNIEPDSIIEGVCIVS